MNCRACGNKILPSDPLFVHLSRTQFEILAGWRLPFHKPCCSEECRDSLAQREREVLAVYVPIVDEQTILEKYPDAFLRKPTVKIR